MNFIVEVGDMKIGKDGDLLITHSLGSCLGLMVYDPVAKLGGLLHAMLPASSLNPDKADRNPFMFVDTGISVLFQTLFDLGVQKNRMIIKAAGCGSPLGKDEIFKIGARNYAIMRKFLDKNNLPLQSEDIGGTLSRTVHFDISLGQTMISSNGKKWEL
ncbi:MAG: chemotaxis protein CheD [Desulfobacterales bacterium]|jgi:chemotaxis protein CheD